MIEYENLQKLNSSFMDEFKTVSNNVIESGWYVLGKHVENFEKEYANYNKVNYCIGVANGLDALTLSLKALDLPEGSEVLVPSNTYIATILSIVQNGLKPVFVEPDISTYNIDPQKIKEKISTKTRAILIVHLYGKACEMDSIMEIVKENNLYLVEDCAQAHGAKYKGKMVGTFGHLSAFSFYPTKNLGALGDAGAVLTNEESLRIRIKRLRNYGSDVKYYNEVIGFNSRLDEIQAAFLTIKLKKLNEIIAHKRNLARIYNQEIHSNFIKPVFHKDYFDVFHIYNIRHENRDSLREYLLLEGIKTEIHYPVSPNKQNAMKEIADDPCPISEEIHRTTLSLPISYFHTEQDVIHISKKINKFSGL